MNKGRALELFFIDGSPDGLLTAEVFNWTGHFLVAPRLQIKQALDRKEAGYSGVYILLGDEGRQPLAYIGEGEDIGKRIREHNKGKEWWNRAILITSTANNLNKSHIKYLEARLISLAQTTKRIKLENAIIPEAGGLTEPARANMEVFLDYVFMVLPALNIDFFINNIRSVPSHDVSAEEVPIFELKSPKHSIVARARLENGEFIVEKDSNARHEWEGKGDWDSSYRKIHAELIQNNVLVVTATGTREHRVFALDYAFRSPSAAAAVVLGRPAGSREWKLQGTNKPFDQWEEEQINSNID